jgi:saccharopine dehydrogenase-like NADP-dependent oxidoreductase
MSKAINDCDLVISAVSGFLGFQTTKTVINNQKNLVDISFLPEDVLELDQLAKDNDVTAIVDCGVAPGMPNIIAGYHNEKMMNMTGKKKYLRWHGLRVLQLQQQPI